MTVTIDTSNTTSLFKEEATLTTDPGVEIKGVIWATRNVDAPGTFTINPEDEGMLYQWNSKIGWSVTDPPVSTDSSSWKYTWNGNNAVTWEVTNNVCPTGWRIPTQSELAQLFFIPSSKWTTMNGKIGREFGSVFLPAAGKLLSNPNVIHSDIGCYWSNQATDDSGNGITASNCIFTVNWTTWGIAEMACGCSVRCVKE